MADYFYKWYIYESLIRTSAHFIVLSIITAAITYSIVRIVSSFRSKQDEVNFLFALFSITILGGLTGFAGGMSRVGVVGDLIPAALTFLAGSVAYLFGVKEKHSLVVAVMVVSFGMSMFFNYSLGSSVRNAFVKKNAKREVCLKVFTSKDILSNDKAFTRAKKLFGENCEKVVNIK